MLFDTHAHCFPPLGEPSPEENAERTRWRLAEHQYPVRFHRQSIRRTRDDAPVAEPLLTGGADGTSGLPEIGFHVGRCDRVEFTVGGDDYYIQWVPPSLEEMSYAPDLLVTQMDYVGVDRAVLQHDRIYAYLRELVDRVGAHSLLWGSDMPACERTVTYRQSLALFQNHCVDLTDTERTALVGGSLARLYPDP